MSSTSARAPGRSGSRGSLLRRAWSWACGAFDFLTQHGWIPLAALLLAGAGLWGFIELADDVAEGETNSFDRRVYLWLAEDLYHRLGPFWHQAGVDISALGGTAVITLIVTGVALFLLFMRQWKGAAFVLVAVLGGLLISLVLKRYFDRDRPDLLEHLNITHTASFPSGHAMNSAVAYLTIAILLMRLIESPRMKAYVLAGGLLIPFLVGISRVFLRVHWPTDVLGGWLIGLAWGLLVYAATVFLQRRGAIEQEGELAAEAASADMEAHAHKT